MQCTHQCCTTKHVIKLPQKCSLTSIINNKTISLITAFCNRKCHPQTPNVARPCQSLKRSRAGGAQRMDGDWACLFSLCPSSSSITWALGAPLALRCWEEAVSLNMLTREDLTTVLRDTLQPLNWAFSEQCGTDHKTTLSYFTALEIKSDINVQQMISLCGFYVFAVQPHLVTAHFFNW